VKKKGKEKKKGSVGINPLGKGGVEGLSHCKMGEGKPSEEDYQSTRKWEKKIT